MSDGQKGTLRYVPDPTWPAELPDNWILGRIPGVDVDADDNVVIINRQDITAEEAEIGTTAPPVIIFDASGKVVTAWGDRDILPAMTERIIVDHTHGIWITGHDAMVQKFSWDGRLLLQIGSKGAFDSSDGTSKGAALNQATDRLFKPASVAVDSANGDIYVADGYGNRRIAVFSASGKFLRQWGRQATLEEAEAGEGGAFIQVVHDVKISRDGLVYVCDRQGDRIQVFDKSGRFKSNIWIRNGAKQLPDKRGTAWVMALSRDAAQKHIFLTNGRNEKVHIIDRARGEIVSSFGRPGHQLGAFTHAHGIAIDSRSRVYVSETDTGKRVQRFVPAP